MINMDKFSQNFITPERFDKTKSRLLHGPNGWLLFVACNSGISLVQDIKRHYEEMLKVNGSYLKEIPLIGTDNNPLTMIFQDTETCPRLTRHVAGSNAFVFQCIHENKSSNSVNENLQQLLQSVRTLKAHRAQTVTVVTPYSPYSRQDKPTFMQREATLAKLFADQLKVAGANIHLTYHPHALSLFGLYEPDMTLVALSGLDLFLEIFCEFKNSKEVVAVSTDSGGAKFTVHFAENMGVSHAIVNKFRHGKDSSDMLGVIGDLENKKTALITDDETVTGSSFLNVVKNLNLNHGIQNIHVGISHLKMKENNIPKLVEAHEKYGLSKMHVTDSIPQIPEILNLDFVEVHSLARRFASTINRLHNDVSVSELFSSIK
ncbi:ribose-phosphate pyrophosphokinase [candidate division WOR-3 bacterium]|nr:ribose-phosphate pyrophosphokinase [candidate division WOR-3 bacterium]